MAERMGVSKGSADAYLTLLLHGSMPMEDVACLLEMSETEIKNTIQELSEKSLLTQNIKTRNMYSAEPVEKLKQIDPELATYFENSILPVFLAQQPRSVMMYEGYEGIRKVYNEVLEEALRTDQPIYAIENIPDKSVSPIGQRFLENYYLKRIAHKVVAYIICPDSPAARKYQKNHRNSLTNVKILPELDIHGATNVAGDLVMSYSLLPPRGTLRHDHTEAHDLKNVFQMLWGLKN